MKQRLLHKTPLKWSFAKGVFLTAAVSGATLFYLRSPVTPPVAPASPLVSVPVILRDVPPAAKAVEPKNVPENLPAKPVRRSAVKKTYNSSKPAAAKIRIRKVFATPPLVLAPQPAEADVRLEEMVSRDLVEDLDQTPEFALDTNSPLEMLAALALQEPSQIDEAEIQLSPVQTDPAFQNGVQPRIERITESLSSLRRNEFPEIRLGLQNAKQELAELKPTPSPVPVLPSATKTRETKPANVVEMKPWSLAAKIPAPTAPSKIVADRDRQAIVSSPLSDLSSKTPLHAQAEPEAATAETAASENSSSGPILVVPPTISSAVGGEVAASAERLALGPVLATAGTPALSTAAALAGNLSTQALNTLSSPNAASPAKETPTVPGPSLERSIPKARALALPTPAAAAVPAPATSSSPVSASTPALIDPTPLGETLRVTLDYDRDLDDFLNVQQGHVQLYLQPYGDKLSRGKVYFTCEGPQRCSVDARAMIGTYQLVARIHTYKPSVSGETTEEYGYVTYGSFISAGNAKEHILFKLNKRDIRGSSPEAAGEEGRVPLLAIFYQAVLGGETEPNLTAEQQAKYGYHTYLLPKSIPNCEVQIVGFPRLGTRRCEADGTVKFASLPKRSQYLLKVTAPGFYPSFLSVPVFNRMAEMKGYLLNAGRMGQIAQKLTLPLAAGRAMLFGRLFDPESRTALKDEVVGLEFRRPGSKTIYFDAEAEKVLPATTDNGLFGFLNLGDPAKHLPPEQQLGVFRSLTRGPGKYPIPMFIRPGAGYFPEIGRLGAKEIYGQVYDAFDAGPIAARVHIMDDKDLRNSVEANAEGKFRLPKGDFPLGTITLETEAYGHPTTLVKHSWDPETRARWLKLPMISQARLDSGLLRASKDAGVTYDAEQGKILAGVGNFSRGGGRCVQPVLYRVNGLGQQEEVPLANGPFPFEGSAAPHRRLCLGSGGWATFINLPESEYVLSFMDDTGREIGGQLVDVRRKRLSTVLHGPSARRPASVDKSAAPASELTQ